jgi:hypothetical protein
VKEAPPYPPPKEIQPGNTGWRNSDNALIPMKERVADCKYDPVASLGNKLFRR